MSILSDTEIIERCCTQQMIEPFERENIRFANSEKVISYGVSSYGYDFRISDEFKIFHNAFGQVIDPKNFDPSFMIPFKGPRVIVPPNSFVLGRTVERFKIPRDIQTVILGKSTYARCGITITVTPFEPEWEGYATIEIGNLTTLPAIVYAHEGIGQILFFKADKACAISYKDKGGKYQNQGAEIVAPMV